MQIVWADGPQRLFLDSLWQAEWGGTTMVSRGTAHVVEHLPAFIANLDGLPRGAITWAVLPTEVEIISLNALTERRGIGSALLQHAEEHWARQGITRVVLVTTNDNLKALSFYQKRGYRLESMAIGAVDRARYQKPAIPLTGDNGIPIHDELVLAKTLR